MADLFTVIALVTVALVGAERWWDHR